MKTYSQSLRGRHHSIPPTKAPGRRKLDSRKTMPLPPGVNGANAVITLRMINNVISEHTSPSSVPFMISQLYMTPVLETCASLSTSSQYTGDKSEGSALLHRFKTRVSSLLQSKLPVEKWIGIALAKAAMESSFECLASNGEGWVRLMVPILPVCLFLSFLSNYGISEDCS